MRVLAGDVGGTKCLLGVVELDGDRARILSESRTSSADHDGIGSVLRHARGELGDDWEAVGLGLPGPVVAGECYLPKLGWRVTEGDVGAAVGGAPARLVNDFVAVGHGLACLGPRDLRTLKRGTADPRGPRAYLGAGTGLGEGYALWRNGAWEAHPSEGGSTDYAPRTEEGCRFLLHYREYIGRAPCWDDVLSGRGLVQFWRFVTESGDAPASDAVVQEMERDDPAAVVSRRGLDGSDAACVRALDLFCENYAAEAGNQAMRFVATGGVYLSGGITPRIAARLDDDAFRAVFCDKGPLRELAERIPVYAVLEPRVGLLGAAAAARSTTAS